MLKIGQVNIKRRDIINDDISGRLQAFLQLKNMEHIMHNRQGWQQLQSVFHNSQSSQDRKRIDVTWYQLAFDPESLHTSCGRDMKLHMVASFKLKRSMSLIGIAFLSGLGSLQVGVDVMDYLLGLSDKVRAKDRPLARLNPVQ
jgi:hypothetical protein